jgi:hypothetical protein
MRVTSAEAKNSMLTRIQQAIRILSTKTERNAEMPDIVISDKATIEVHKISRFIGQAIALLLVILTAGPLATLFSHMIPEKPHYSLTTMVGIITSILAILGSKLLEVLNHRLHDRLNIAERIAPYFGRRLYESYRILRS